MYLLSEDKIEMRGKLLFNGLICIAILICAPAVMGENVTLTVASGDTLYSIGRTYKVSVQELIQANGIVNPRALKEGMEITVPHTYIIERGDTLYGIARAYETSVSELSDYNELDEGSFIKIGQVILLPHDRDESVVAEAGQTGDSDTGKTGLNGNSAYDEGYNRNESPIVNASYDASTDASFPVWPHNGSRSSLNGKLKGIQILGERGDQILSVCSGEVVWVAPYRGYGTLVMVETGDRHIFAYGGNESTYVDVGDRIERGTVLGKLGINQIQKEAKVFFFVYKDGKPVDPASAPRG